MKEDPVWSELYTWRVFLHAWRSGRGYGYLERKAVLK
jgi:hypothetical protein